LLPLPAIFAIRAGYIASSSLSSIYFRKTFTFKRFRGIHVMTAQSAEQRRFEMFYTIDSENNVTAHATAEEAAATTTTPFDTFASEQELAELAAGWPAERLLAILNSLPGEKPTKKLKDPKTAVARIWQRIQGLGDAAKPAAAPAKPKPDKKAKGRAQSAKGAPGKGKATKKATPAKAAPKAKKAAKAKEATGPREGSKMAQAIALLSRKNGATLNELAERFAWKIWTVRGFIAGSLKKAGYKVESFKSDKGERTYRINQ
jgi:hypothetical protein